MRIKVLITGNDLDNLALEAELLKGHGFLIYTCPNENAEDFVQEINPDVVYVNPQNPDAQTTQVYHNLLQLGSRSGMPVIYTLMEDGMYIVNLPHSNMKTKKKAICDNIVDAIKIALHADVQPIPKIKRSRSIQFPSYSLGA